MLVSQVVRRDERLTRERMVGRNDDDLLVLEQGCASESALIHVAGHDGEIERSIQQRAHRVRRRFGDDAYIHPRPFLSERGDDCWEPVVARVALGRQSHDARSAGILGGYEVPLEGLDFMENATGGRENSFAHSGEHHATARPDEEWRSESRLQLAELVAECGLGQVQSTRGTCLTTGFRDRGDEPEVSEVDLERPWARAGIVVHERHSWKG